MASQWPSLYYYQGLLLLMIMIISAIATASGTAIASSSSIQKGYSESPDPSSPLNFQPLLTDPTSTFSLGFLRINSTTSFHLCVIHLPSSFPLWRAIPNSQLPQAAASSWSSSSSLSFNGTLLILSDPETGLSWSTTTTNTDTDINNAKVLLLNSSNLQIVAGTVDGGVVIWQSFDFPSDTLVQNQNFTSRAALYSANGKYSMSLGPTYMALYMVEQRQLGLGTSSNNKLMYWKHTATEAKAIIIEGGGPVYARVDPTGFLGLYQKDTAPVVDVQPFDSFSTGLIKRGLRRLTLESGDGNLRAYYWGGGGGVSAGWVLDFVAIRETCQLPAPCGPYGTCHQGNGSCGCLLEEGCLALDSESGTDDLCNKDVDDDDYRAIRKGGVDLANKELLGFQKVASMEECEGLCASNCSCWGAVYNNASSAGFCYLMDYPIQTVLAVGDQRKLGYFKVAVTTTTTTTLSSNNNNKAGKISAAGLVWIIIGALLLATACAYATYRAWSQRRSSAGEDQSVIMPHYKDLNSASIEIEMSSSHSFRK